MCEKSRVAAVERAAVITPQMVEAGAAVFEQLVGEVSQSSVAREVFQAMIACCRDSGCTGQAHPRSLGKKCSIFRSLRLLAGSFPLLLRLAGENLSSCAGMQNDRRWP